MNMAVVKYLISSLIKHLSGTSDEYTIEPRIAIEILMLFTRLVAEDEQKLISLYSIIIPVLVRQEEVDKSYLHDKLIFWYNKMLVVSNKLLIHTLMKIKRN